MIDGAQAGFDTRCCNCDAAYRRASTQESTLCPACRRKPNGCTVCGEPVSVRKYLRCDRCVEAGVVAPSGPARIDGITRYDDDPECQRFVEEHPGGASIYEIGDALGISGERVRQIEAVALRRLRARLALVGLSIEDLAPGRAHPLAGGGW